MILKDWMQVNSGKLEKKELFYLVKAVLGVAQLDIGVELKICAERCLNVCLERRVKGEPLSKIIQLKPFWNDYFITTNDTLDPRPETEFLIEKILGKPRSVLDLGTGTGCLVLSILKKFSRARGVGVDISKETLDVARENASILGLAKKVDFVLNHWANGLSGNFDLVIANPPYVSYDYKLSVETSFDPASALFGDIETYADLLNSLSGIGFGQLILELPEYLLDSVTKLMQALSYSFTTERIYNTEVFCLSCLNKKKQVFK